jgi:serine/threonine protein kinase
LWRCCCRLQGSFGAVYLGTWQGNTVAVKVMNLPTEFLEEQEDREKPAQQQQQQHEAQQQQPVRDMEAPPPHYAIIEAVLSSMMSHPNIVQVNSHATRMLTWQQAGDDSMCAQQQVFGMLLYVAPLLCV